MKCFESCEGDEKRRLGVPLCANTLEMTFGGPSLMTRETSADLTGGSSSEV